MNFSLLHKFPRESCKQILVSPKVLLFVAVLFSLSSCTPPTAPGPKDIAFNPPEYFVCHSPDSSTPTTEIVFSIVEGVEPITYFYGGDLLISSVSENGDFHEVFQRPDRARPEDQFFDIVRFTRTSGVLIHGYGYYMSDKNYRETFGRRDTATHSFINGASDPELLALLTIDPKPGNTVQMAWQKSDWTCAEVFPFTYPFYYLASTVLNIMANAG